MGTALTHIRASIAQQNSLPTSLEPALYGYVLAQKFGLRPEALQTARTISLKQSKSKTIEDLDNKFDIMSGSSLYELLKYQERVQAILASDLAEFSASCARGTITGLRCTELSSSQIPSWLDKYIESIGKTRAYLIPLNSTSPWCATLKPRLIIIANVGPYPARPYATSGKHWHLLSMAVSKRVGFISRAGSRGPSSPNQLDHVSACDFDVSDTNLIIRSSDLVDFRVHKSVLAIASPFFKDPTLSSPTV
ncbi:hypothetical protein BJV77DRAFT_688624 [Russula vinacea]|nr:hypothetical protein BJV77DRAFT_688624 [Russula vinacea]